MGRGRRRSTTGWRSTTRTFRASTRGRESSAWPTPGLTATGASSSSLAGRRTGWTGSTWCLGRWWTRSRCWSSGRLRRARWASTTGRSTRSKYRRAESFSLLKIAMSCFLSRPLPFPSQLKEVGDGRDEESLGQNQLYHHKCHYTAPPQRLLLEHRALESLLVKKTLLLEHRSQHLVDLGPLGHVAPTRPRVEDGVENISGDLGRLGFHPTLVLLPGCLPAEGGAVGRHGPGASPPRPYSVPKVLPQHPLAAVLEGQRGRHLCLHPPPVRLPVADVVRYADLRQHGSDGREGKGLGEGQSDGRRALEGLGKRLVGSDLIATSRQLREQLQIRAHQRKEQAGEQEEKGEQGRQHLAA
mmetsp:Transcript_10552/g.21375  ORF Transcript_10552/g.21375 Transcript_10552/m.21375 type:complete len:356 (+) Transcript_10552:423-1490(+)